MNPFRTFYSILILALAVLVVMFSSANKGYDLGYRSGYDQAILDHKVLVDCKFQANCQLDFDRGLRIGLSQVTQNLCEPKKVK